MAVPETAGSFRDVKVFPAVGVLGGGSLPEGYLRRLTDLADFVAAADSGADRLLAEGVTPHLTLGDFDSVMAPRERLGETLHLADQETSDADKLLAELGRRGHPRIVLTGVEGDLPDHVLASIQSAAKSPGEVWFAFRRGFGRIVRAREAVGFDAEIGQRVSLIPLVECTGVVAEGLAWEVPEGRLHPLGPTGVSNRAVRPSVKITVATGILLLFAETSDEPISGLASSFKRP